mmetsp:Transcript_24742/g.61673  ORF Transcript_24742/g.61673 Transcript_24742/m.61673 type:complete len:208 (+) Transcript_24742:6140-6763(+)
MYFHGKYVGRHRRRQVPLQAARRMARRHVVGRHVTVEGSLQLIIMIIMTPAFAAARVTLGSDVDALGPRRTDAKCGGVTHGGELSRGARERGAVGCDGNAGAHGAAHAHRGYGPWGGRGRRWRRREKEPTAHDGDDRAAACAPRRWHHAPDPRRDGQRFRTPVILPRPPAPGDVVVEVVHALRHAADVENNRHVPFDAGCGGPRGEH